MTTARLRQGAIILLAVLVAVLAVTGAWLWFEYRPSAAAEWNDLDNPQLRGMFRMRIVHRGASHVAVYVVVGLLVAHLADARRRRTWPFWAWATAVVLAGSFTGYLLPWDQLALWAVTVGTNMSGVRAVFGDGIRFVLIDGVEVSVATYRRWAVVHVALPVAGALVPAMWVLSWRWRRPRRGPDRACSTTTSRT